MAWIILILLLIWHVASVARSMRRRMYLFNYILSLLLDDGIRADQKAKLESWIPTSGATDASRLYHMTREALESYIQGWTKATGYPILAAQSALWDSVAAKALKTGSAQTKSSAQ